MQISVCIISNTKGLKRIEPLWNSFISQHTEYPFLLNGFVNQFLRPNTLNSKPCILVFFIDNEIVGVVPVEVIDGQLYRKCVFLFQPWFPADLVFDPKYTKILMKETFTILFNNLRCHVVDFTLPIESPYVPFLKEVCKEVGVAFLSSPFSGRAIIPVNSSWSQFERSKRHLRREFERTERRMREMGQLSIKWFENEDSKAEILEKVLVVERTSWKSSNQPLEKFKVDPSILLVLNGCVQTSLTVPSFNWGAAILELNGVAIAHSIFLDYKGHAYICKTSFDNRYKKYGPGIYINYVVVRELMNKAGVEVIDFMNDLPFLHKWTSNIVSVNRFIMSRKGLGLLYLLERILPTNIAKVHKLGKSFDKFIIQLARFLKIKIFSGAN